MPIVPGPPHHAGVVIPIRGFNSGKARLAEVLGEHEREDLATAMANAVVDAAGALPVTIVSSSPEVQAWARTRGLALVEDPGTGLDGAVAAGRDALRDQGYVRVIVAHADLPRARPASLERFAAVGPSVVTIVPSHRDDGTPVLGIPSRADFGFAYGVGSADRHAGRARALGLEVEVVLDADLGFDVDLPEDLEP
jgi:2-phospho-L-lactate guanylyltransferase